MPSGTRYRFPAEYRVKRRRDYLAISESGRLHRCSHFLVLTRQRPDGPTRLGVTVTRKIGGAVVRNRIKRYLREFFRLEHHLLPAGLDISIIARRGADRLAFTDVQRELRRLRLFAEGSTD